MHRSEPLKARSLPTWAKAALLVALVLGLAVGGGRLWRTQMLRDEGHALFNGQQALPAQLAGQSLSLPVLASRCSNCHQVLPPQPRPDGVRQGAGNTLASPLSATWLTQARQRHGGPPTIYGRAEFCRLMREGVDPGAVVIDTVMPRYALTPDQCEALWTYLTTS